jgi:flagellar hook assembly protein FlgD
VSLLARAVFVLLVVATFAAFFVAQRLKSAPTVANLRSISQHFSPNGDGRRDVAQIRLRIRRDDDVTVSMVDDNGTEVKRLATAVPATPDKPLRLSWDGRADDGTDAPEGPYRVRVSLRSGNRAVTLRPGVNLDLTAPRPTVKVGGPDGRDWITGPVAGPIPFRVLVTSRRLPTRIRVLRTDDGPPREVAALTLPPGVREGTWDGRADGRPAPPGTYQIVAFVRDQAGNVGRSAPAEPGPTRGDPGVSVRTLMAQPPADPVQAGGTATFKIDSRGRPYRWRVFRVGEREARAKGRRPTGGTLNVKAPEGRSGVYVLKLETGRHATAVPFSVQAADTAPILVVLPAATWFGRDTLDDDRDGWPNTLDNGSPAAYPRLLQGGLPAGFSDDAAALLAFLDAQRIHYDVTTDLTLAATRTGLSGERQGVLLAGPFRWISNDLARRLRRYVTEGGLVASFGVESLRRGVGIARDELVRPLPPSDTDPFGTKLRPPRRVTSGDPLQPTADEGDTGLLTGVDQLPGMSVVEESDPARAGRVRVALAAVDPEAFERAETSDDPLPETFPALALTEEGRGRVIRVGLPQWGAKLRAGSVPVQQLTRNIADILRGAKPRIRSF